MYNCQINCCILSLHVQFRAIQYLQKFRYNQLIYRIHWEQHINKLDQGFSVTNSPRTTSRVGCKSLLQAINLVITPACLYTFGREYRVLQMRCIHRTPHLAHVVLLSVISNSHSSVKLSTLTIYQYIQYSVSACYKLVIASSQLRIQFIMSNYYTWFYACSVLFYFSISIFYMLSTFQVPTHMYATSSRDIG